VTVALEEIALQGNEPLVLEGGGAAWRVASGAVAVCAVCRLGQRRHLFDVGAGDILLGMTDPEEARRTLIAVPVQPTVLEPVESVELSRAALDAWAARLTAAIEPLRPHLETPLLRDAGDGARLEPGFERRFFRALADLDRLAETQARSRLEQQRRWNHRLAADTLEALAGVSGESESGRFPAASASPLVAAVQAIGEAQGFTVRPPAGDREVAREPLQALALASGVRTRTVLLRGKWWLGENGPLLAYRASDQSPVVLLPTEPSRLGGLFRRSRYVLVDPADGSRRPVDLAVASTLDPVACGFYRPLGEKRGAWDLLRFGLKGYGKDLRILLLCSLAVTLFALVTPQATALLFTHAIPDADRGLLFQIALGMAAAVLGSMLFDLTRAVSALRIQSGLGIVLQAAAWDWLLKLSPTFFRNFSAGELRARVEGVSRIQEQFRPETQRALTTGLTAFLYLALMLYYSVPLGLLAAAFGLLAAAATVLSWISLNRLQAALQQLEGSLSGLMVQLINAVPKLRVAGAEERAFACWGRSYSRKQRLVEQVQRVRDRLRLVNATAPVLAMGLGFSLVLEVEDIDVGTYLAFNLALGAFLQAITELSDTAGGLVSITTHWRRTKTILEAPPEVDAAKAHPGRLSGRLALDHVTFRYRKDGRLTLEDVSLHAEAGECIALVGPSGSGKSTILNLLLGFETPSSGAVLLDGHDLVGLDLAAVRRQMGVVRQDSRLMSQSIFENIVCGSRATMDDAWEAARAAGLAEDIEQMPMGMHTIVSEGGGNLSGGQRQRLLIARALVLKPKILLFDEATSALDNRTQRIVTESIQRLQATRVVVAHRLSTIRQADRIYVLEAGRIVQQGSFDELAGRPGLFAQLMKRQAM
jgi:NHLM bacteriocin system ABC transporter ATP-binding protein